MSSSTTTRLSAMPMQIDQRLKLSSVSEKTRCRNPISVTRMIAASATPYRRSCVGPGIVCTFKIVCS